MLFQGMFFVITPALICGAFAERMKFSTMVVFMILWGTLIYCPLCHWVWGGGVLTYGSPHAERIFAGGALDFAGGTVVHISSGVTALICAMLLGKRLGYGSEPMPPHNLTYTAVGRHDALGGLVRFQRRQRPEGRQPGRQRLCRHAPGRGRRGADLGGHGMARPRQADHPGHVLRRGGRPGVHYPGLRLRHARWALVMGVAVGIVCYLACTALKSRFKYDDSLDVFGVHGMGGTLGAILTGVFATRATGATFDVSGDKVLGLIEGGQVWKAQLVAVAVTWVLAIVGTFILLKVLDAVMGLRVSREAEIEGLDISQQGEEGYIFI